MHHLVRDCRPRLVREIGRCWRRLVQRVRRPRSSPALLPPRDSCRAWLGAAASIYRIFFGGSSRSRESLGDAAGFLGSGISSGSRWSIAGWCLCPVGIIRSAFGLLVRRSGQENGVGGVSRGRLDQTSCRASRSGPTVSVLSGPPGAPAATARSETTTRQKRSTTRTSTTITLAPARQPVNGS